MPSWEELNDASKEMWERWHSGAAEYPDAADILQAEEEDAAEALLKSRLGKIIDARIEEERVISEQAWDDGYKAGFRDEAEGWIKNPYRRNG